MSLSGLVAFRAVSPSTWSNFQSRKRHWIILQLSLTILAAIAIALAPFHSVAADLFGITFNSSTRKNEFHSVDPTTGTTTSLAAADVGGGWFPNTFVGDPNSARVFLQGLSGNNIYQLQGDTAFSTVAPGVPLNFLGMRSDGNLVGIGSAPAPGGGTLLRLYTIAPMPGIVPEAPAQFTIPEVGINAFATTLDPANGTLYLIVGNALYRFDTKNKASLGKVSLAQPMVQMGVRSDGTLIGIPTALVGQSLTLATIDASTGLTSQISSLPITGLNLGSFTVARGTNDYVHLISGRTLYTIDAQTGIVLNSSTLATTMQALTTSMCIDTDGDALCDEWERNGLTVQTAGGPVFLDLPAMGADPLHKDIFVQADYMIEANGFQRRLPLAAQQLIIDAFERAQQVTNPERASGIRLHIDCGPDCIMNPVTKETWGNNKTGQNLSLAKGHQITPGNTSLSNLNFATALTDIRNAGLSIPFSRAQVFRYAVLGIKMTETTNCGTKERGGVSPIIGSNFLVTVGIKPGDMSPNGRQIPQSSYNQFLAGTFMHELGHNLGLAHGGPIIHGADTSIHINYKPNHLSVMNYSWQTGILKDDVWSKNFPFFFRPSMVLDFSQFANPTLDEENGLNESAGINGVAEVNDYRVIYWCQASGEKKTVISPNGPIDWNCNGLDNEKDVMTNINNDFVPDSNSCPTSVPALHKLASHNEWNNLIFYGGSIGKSAAAGVVAFETTGPVSDEPDIKGLWEQVGQFERMLYDFNGDGKINMDDVTILQSRVNKPLLAPGDKADINKDGKIDALDVRLLVNQCDKSRCAR